MELYCSECGRNIMYIPPTRPLPEKLRQFCPYCEKVVDLTDKAPDKEAKPKAIPRKREILMVTDGVANFKKVTGVEFCRLPETRRTRGSTQIHIKYHTDESANEQWMPLDNAYGVRFYRTTGRNMDLTSDIMGLRAQILHLEKQIQEKLDQLQDPITDKNIGCYFHEEKIA